MTVYQIIQKRRAFRALSSQPIPDDILVNLAEAAHLAPSCSNNQPWRMITVKSASQLDLVKKALTSGNYWANPSPAITAFVTHQDWDARQSDGRDYAFFDTGMAAMNYQLLAVEEGLHAHPIAGFDPQQVKSALRIPESAILLALVVLGFPGEIESLNEKHRISEVSERVRKPLSSVFSFDFWNEALIPSPL